MEANNHFLLHLDLYSNQMNPILTLLTNSFQFDLNIIVEVRLCPSSGPFLSGFLWKLFMHFFTSTLLKISFTSSSLPTGKKRPCHRWGSLVAGFSTRPPGFEPRSGNMGFVLDKVALGQVSSEYFGFSCQFSFHRPLHIHYLLFGAGTIGQLLADVPSGLSLTPSKDTKIN
jgi:hypothetical protein